MWTLFSQLHGLLYIVDNVYISIFEQFFFLCCLKYESFSNCEESYYRNIGYFGEIYTCENFTFLHSEKKM